MFVRAGGRWASLGTGKLIGKSGRICSVEYFEAPVAELNIIDLDAADLEVARLPEQTRVFYFNAAAVAWEIGRVLDDQGDRQFVKFPNGVSRHLPVADVFVRGGRQIGDPTWFLGAKINETPRFADDRSKFVRSVVSQRAAAMGMAALTSSAVELEAHQIEVVRRVLQDPIQRYLLADEVGLGKTVEAGVLIRQSIIDGGEHQRVLVAVPKSLVRQWRSELVSKFFLGHCLDKTMHVVSLDDGHRIRSLLGEADMLVIDEAHHLTDRRSSVDPYLYRDVAEACVNIERVLLLSATPAIHNERGFLEMLHLLDPQTYPLDDEEGFRRRVATRQSLAEIVAGLTPQNVLFLDATLDRLADLFPADRLLAELTDDLKRVSERMPPEDDTDLVDAVSKVRSHLSESYRLHRRILRHRRSSVGGLTPGRSGMTVADYSCVETAGAIGCLEDWRLSELNLSPNSGGGISDDGVADLFLETLERILQYRAVGPSQGLPPMAVHSALDPDAFRHVVRRSENSEMYEARAFALVATLRPLIGTKRQFVVFCTHHATADSLAAFLALHLDVPVDRHDPDDETWLTFNTDPTRSLLVCDRRAEEGLNLQGGNKTIVHYDLPINPNRMEQRLGRVDRYGSGDPLRSVVLRCVDNPLESRWIEYLDSGLRVFDRSIASLQYLIEDSMSALPNLLFDEGIDAMIDLTARSAGDEGLIERELRSIDQQDALEALGTPPAEVFEALSNVDEDWQTLERDGSDWIERTLQFARTASGAASLAGPKDPAIFRYRYNTFDQHTLMPLQAFFEHCREAVDLSPASRVTRQVHTVPLTYRRRTALGRLGRTAGTRVLRFGDPFITGMWELAQADDRGRSTALWRHIPGYMAEDIADLFFRVDFVVTADLQGPREILERRGRLTRSAAASISRRGDMALPPFFQTIWLDQGLAIVDDVATLTRLGLRYRAESDGQGGRDFNLNPKRWRHMAKLEMPQMEHWAQLCLKARERAEECLRNLPSFTDSLGKAALEASAADYTRLGQLRARAGRSRASTDESDWILEKSLSESLMEGVRRPLVHVDAILACFMSGDPAAAAIIDGRA